MYHMYNDGILFMGGLHFLWWMVWLAVLGAMVFYGWRRTGERCRRPRESPHEALQRRLANGEITPEQYEERKALLDRDATHTS